MQPILEVTDLSHSFGGLKALTHLSLEIFPGELVGLIGPNGAGKTTVFNLITGVFPITAGRIVFRGEDISDWRSHRITAAGIARTFQNIRLFKDLSVLDNVRLGASAQHHYSLLDALRRSRRFTASEQEVTRQAFELLERFHLTHYAHTPARHLPYGEQRRIEMARALISRPQLLLLDEPAAGMNQSETEDLIRRIRQLQEEFALTILMIEHQMRVVVNLCQRLTVLDFGQTIAERLPPGNPAPSQGTGGLPGQRRQPGEPRPGAGRGDPLNDDRTPLLAVEDVWVSYDRIDAVRGVSFEVHQGEIVTLIGANGAGKSTILQAISGLLPVARGRVVLEGLDLLKVPAHLRVARGIAHVPEGRGIFGNLTVLENLRLATYRRRDGEIEPDLEEVFRLFPRLGERRRQWGNTLSGGEQQMLAVGRALMSRARLLLLDEPSMGLAPLLVQEIFRVIQGINQQGTAILLVEQNAHLALEVAHRAYILETGEIALSGPASELRHHPRVQAAYLGGE